MVLKTAGMKQGSAPPAFPEALQDDDDDVTWALQTAGVQWRRNAHRDALEWLSRAVEAAVDGGRVDRARALQQTTNALEAALDRGAFAPAAWLEAEDADDAEPLASDAYGELAVDIDLEPEEVDAQELNDDDLLEEDVDEADVVALAGEAEEEEDRPTLPPTSSDRRGAAVIAMTSGKPLPPTPSAPFALSSSQPSSALPPASRRPSSLPPLSGESPFPPSVRPSALPSIPPPPAAVGNRALRGRTATGLGPGHAGAGAKRAGSAARGSRPRTTSLPPLGELSERMLPSDTPPQTLSSRRTSSVPPSARAAASVPVPVSQPPVSVSPASQPPVSIPASPVSVSPESERTQRGTFGSYGDEEVEEHPTERNLEAAISSNVQVARFSNPPDDETTERELDPVPNASEPAPSSRERTRLDSLPAISLPASEQPPLSDSTPPTKPSPELPQASASDQPPPEDTETRIVAQPALNPPAAAALPPSPPPLAELYGVSLANVAGLEDLPEESQLEMTRNAKIDSLAQEEEVSHFGLALVLKGEVSVMPAIADVTSARAKPGDLIFSQGHLAEGVELRVVATASGAVVASWQSKDFEQAILDCPWVGDELKIVGDRFQTLAGVAMGPIGEQLDEMLRAMIVERCEIKRLLPGEVLAEAGRPVPGMIVLGAGTLELVDGAADERVKSVLRPGDFLFAAEILAAAPAPSTARAGKNGALLLFAERKVAHELLVSVPPLLGIFAQ